MNEPESFESNFLGLEPTVMEFTEMTDVHANVTDLRGYKKEIVTFNRLITTSSNTS